MNSTPQNRKGQNRAERTDNGFSLIEMVIALVILFIAVMGVFAAVTWATRYNRGNSQRSQALAVMQREIEFYRAAKFTPNVLSITQNEQDIPPACPDAIGTDNGSRDLRGGTYTDIRCGIDGTLYQVNVTIDDDPSTTAVESYPWPRPAPAPSPAPTPLTMLMKQITIVVTPAGVEGGWVTANAIQMTFRRVKAN